MLHHAVYTSPYNDSLVIKLETTNHSLSTGWPTGSFDCKGPAEDQDRVFRAGSIRDTQPVNQPHIHEKIARIRAFFDAAPLREIATATVTNHQVRST